MDTYILNKDFFTVILSQQFAGLKNCNERGTYVQSSVQSSSAHLAILMHLPFSLKQDSLTWIDWSKSA